MRSVVKAHMQYTHDYGMVGADDDTPQLDTSSTIHYIGPVLFCFFVSHRPNIDITNGAKY